MQPELTGLIIGILLFAIIGYVGRTIFYLIWYFFKWLAIQRPQLEKIKEPIEYG